MTQDVQTAPDEVFAHPQAPRYVLVQFSPQGEDLDITVTSEGINGEASVIELLEMTLKEMKANPAAILSE